MHAAGGWETLERSSKGRCAARGKNRGCRAGLISVNETEKLMKKLLTLSLVIIAATALSAAAGDAKALYDKSCAKCHGKEGKGDTKMGQKLGIKDYTDAKVQAEMKDEAATTAIKEGLKDKDGKVLMKPAEDLSADDIKALVAYMRTFKK
jgi:cytochrome c553